MGHVTIGELNMPESPSPSSNTTIARVIPLSDIDISEGSVFFPNWRGRFEQISRGRFNGTIWVVRGGLVRIVESASNQRVRGVRP